MMKNAFWRKLSLILVVVVLLSGVMGYAMAQSAIGSIQITKIDTSQFPEISVYAQLLDSNEQVVSSVGAGDVVLMEDDQEMAFDVASVQEGMKTAVVLDLGSWSRQKSLVDPNKRNYELMQDTVLDFIGTMHETDYVELIVVNGNQAEVLLPFTNNKDRLRQAVASIDWEESTEASYGLKGVELAYQEQKKLDSRDEDVTMNVVFLTAGIMNQNSVVPNDLGQSLRKDGIFLFSVYYPWASDGDLFGRVEEMHALAPGESFTFDSVVASSEINTYLNEYRYQYKFTYRSESASVNERIVTLDSVSQLSVLESDSFTISRDVVESGTIDILVNGGNVIQRKALERTDDLTSIPVTEVPVFVTLKDWGNKDVVDLKLLVDGQPKGVFVASGDGTYTAMWDVKDITIAGSSSYSLEVIVTDELGLSKRQAVQASVDVVIPAPTSSVCRAVGNLPGGFGEKAGELCEEWGVTTSTLMNTGLSIVVIILLILMWRNREKVAAVGKEVIARTTNVIQRMTNRWRSSDPKAKLVAVRGIPTGKRQTFEIFGETPIGRNAEYAELILENNNISRLHATIHEEEMTGTWSIEDNESANGTYLNGVRLIPFRREALNDGDEIELCIVERGGIKFKFELLKSKKEENDVLASPFVSEGTDTSARQEPDKDNPADVANQRW